MAAAVLLCGFMATGKSTVGKLLADALGCSFVDLDDAILRSAGVATIAELFAMEQEAGFRRREAEALARWASTPDAVVALGGGAVANDEAWRTIASAGATVVCLDATMDEIFARVGITAVPTAAQLEALYTRPILAAAFGVESGGRGSAAPGAEAGGDRAPDRDAVARARTTLEQLWARRRPWYQRAALVLPTAGRPPATIAEELAAWLTARTRSSEQTKGSNP